MVNYTIGLLNQPHTCAIAIFSPPPFNSETIMGTFKNTYIII